MIKSIINVGAQAVIKLLLAVVSLKIVAYYAGPSGLVVLGQLQSFLQIAGAGASSMTSTGVVKLISENAYKGDKVVRASLFLLVIYCVLVFLFLLLGSGSIAKYFLEGQYVVLLLVLPLAAFFLGINSLHISYYNGRQDYRRYFLYSVALSFLIAFITILLAIFFLDIGAISSVIIAPIISGAILLVVFRGWMRKRARMALSEFWGLSRSLLQFSLMAIGSAIVVYGGQIYLRQFISDHESISAAGIWYSATRLSDIYMGIASVLFSTILLPRYSTLTEKLLLAEVLKFLMLAAVFAVVMVVSVKVSSGILVHIIYGEAFLGASEILDIYVLGDALKVLTWVLLYVFIAKQKVMFYLVYEVLSSFVYVLLSIVAYKRLGLYFTSLGYVIQAAISLVVLLLWLLVYFKASFGIREAVHD